MTTVSIGVLGPFEVRVDDEIVDLGSPKQRAVLGILTALAPGLVPVERLVDEIWGDAGPANPLRSLQVYVSALRQALGPAGDLLVTEGRAYRLDVDSSAYEVALDVVEFEKAVATATSAADPSDAAEAAEAALELWRGDAWQDLSDLPVVGPPRVALDEQRLAAVAVRARALLDLGRHRELVGWLEPWVAQHPLNEELRGHLMLALHRSDRQADALESYAEGRELKADETGLDPSADLQRLHGLILNDDPGLRSEDVEIRSRRHLPAQMTALFGREAELDDLVGLVTDGARLVTLTGPGGIGKTRVGLALAHRLADFHPDGVWFVALDAIHDPMLVARAIAQVLDVEEAAGDILAPLRHHLSSRRILLLLDNFEQVVEAASLVSDLLAAAPGLTVIVTSRVQLRVYGERVVPVEPLEIGDAVPLFVDRARSVDHRFAPVGDQQIAELCEFLDRIPLALELVAARVDELSVPEIRRQLAERRALDLATDGPRDRGARQQSLRGAIEWSIGLLPDEQRAAFARLGVFDGGFTPAAAEAVAGTTLRDLATLTRASLVVPAGPGRHRMLETLRAYAAELLGAERAQVAEAHATWVHQTVVGSEVRMNLGELYSWISGLDPERANIRAALAWFVETADDDRPRGRRLLELSAALGLYWYNVGPGSKDTDYLSVALEIGVDAAPELRGRAAYSLAICRGEQGLVEEAIELCRTAAELFRDSDPQWAARALSALAGLTADTGRFEEAAVLMDEGIALIRSLENPLPLALPLVSRAKVAVYLGDAATARACVAEVLADDPDPRIRAFADLTLADVELLDGDPLTAGRHVATAVDILEQYDYQAFRMQEALEILAVVAVRVDRADLAATLLSTVDHVHAEDGSHLVPSELELRERRTAAGLAALDEDVRRDAEARGRQLGLADALVLARRELAIDSAVP